MLNNWIQTKTKTRLAALTRSAAVAASTASVLALCLPVAAQPASAASSAGVVNLYSARHYQTDEALYDNFSKLTGIKVNRVDADDAGILARLRAEGSASPADVILLVDAARLWKGDADGLFQPIKSKALETAIPVRLRAQSTPEGTTWFGFSTRARVVVYDKQKVQAADVDTYEELADPKNKGRLCTRSGSHPYNLSLFGAMQEHLGEAKTEQWLKGLVANMARDPKGGDTDQIKGVASGECGIALANTYYIARILRSEAPADKAIADRIGVVFPDQQGAGTHVNIAGAAVAKHAKNTANAIRFMEYLASLPAQEYFANGNNEWPAVANIKLTNPALQAMAGDGFKPDAVTISAIGKNQVKVQQMLDRVGYR